MMMDWALLMALRIPLHFIALYGLFNGYMERWLQVSLLYWGIFKS